MRRPPTQAAVLQIARASSVVRPRDLAARGIPRHALYTLVAQGKLIQIGRGLYRLPHAEFTENHSLAEVSKRAPNAVVCLLSALRFHGLTTELPSEVWIAIGPKAWAPTFPKPRLRCVRFSGPALTEGVEVHAIEGVRVQIYSVAKTIADCFKFRNKIGTSVGIEALREAWTKRRVAADDLWRHATHCRVNNIMRPYLESLA